MPWNYPFHNVFNPVSAALMSGNGIVVKVSEYASWSAAGYFGAALKACLRAGGAPEDLVEIRAGKGRDIGQLQRLLSRSFPTRFG